MATMNVGQFVKSASDPKRWNDRLFYIYEELTQDQPEKAEYIQTQLQQLGIDYNQFLGAYNQYLSNSLADSGELILLSDIKPEEKSFLIPTYIPDGCITVIAGEGGTGKTFVWCDIVAAVTTGRMPFFVQPEMLPKEWTRNKPQRVLLFSAEDSFRYVLEERLIQCGADCGMIHATDPDTIETPICFDPRGYKRIEHYIHADHPALCVFDPVQSFLPANIKIGDRGSVRSALQPLITLAHRYGTTMLLVMHGNKTHGATGTNRVADSKDFTDMARSVLMVGYADDKKKTRYLTHEKSNYSRFGETALFSLEQGKPEFCGYTDKKDREFILETGRYEKFAPAKDPAKDFYIAYLSDDQKHLVSEVDSSAIAKGISQSALKRAKRELSQQEVIKFEYEGFGKDKKTFVSLQS